MSSADRKRARRIGVVTGSRSDFGLLHPLLSLIDADRRMELSLLATGAHLSPEFGSTETEIEEANFRIAERVEMLLSSDSEQGVAKSVGLGVIGMTDALARLRPDVLVVLGDRFEIFAAAQAAMFLRIPVAHIHGGELTEGAIDDAIRHAITKMSQLHFVATEEYRRRVIQMGEAPDRVFNTGAPGLDRIRDLDFVSRKAVAADIGLELDEQLFLVTYHPATVHAGKAAISGVDGLLDALDEFPEAAVVFTFPNADARGREVLARIKGFVAANGERARVFDSLGSQRYLSVMRHSTVVIGNSSSGILEAPSLGIPTVDIGDRQQGRVRAGSVINCEPNREAIVSAIGRSMDPEFRRSCRRVENPYGDGRSSEKIHRILASISFAEGVRKRFFDLGIEMSSAGDIED